MKGITLIKAVMFSCLLLAGFQTVAQESMPTPEVEPLNINQADAETIAMMLDGVGQARAEAIVAYREENGNFETVEDLMMVSGIGEFTIRNNQDKITFK